MTAKKNPAAVALGRLGGKVKSERKAAAARKNGQKGGWPKGKKRTPVDAARRQYVEEVISPLMATLPKGKRRKGKR